MKLKYFILSFSLLLIFTRSYSQKGDDKIDVYKRYAIDLTAAYLCSTNEPPVPYRINQGDTLQYEKLVEKINVITPKVADKTVVFLNFLLKGKSNYSSEGKNYSFKPVFKDFINNSIIEALSKKERNGTTKFIKLQDDLNKLLSDYEQAVKSTSKSNAVARKGKIGSETTPEIQADKDAAERINADIDAAATIKKEKDAEDKIKADEAEAAKIKAAKEQEIKESVIKLEKAKTHLVLMWIFVILLLIAGSAGYLLYKEYLKRLNKLMQKNNSLGKEISEKEENIRKLNNEILNFKENIRVDGIAIDKLNKEIKELKLKEPSNIQSGITSTPSPPPPPPPPPIRYATSPDNPEGFSVSSLKPEKESRSIYKITFSNTDSAIFEIVDDRNAISIALNNSSYILQPACEYENSPSDGENIKTLKAGKLIKNGNIWRIQEKALIRFL